MLSVDGVIEAAQAATGLSDFGGDSWRAGLELMVADINADRERPAETISRGSSPENRSSTWEPSGSLRTIS